MDLTSKQKRATFAACAAATQAMCGSPLRIVFAYICDDYPNVAGNIQYLAMTISSLTAIFVSLIIGPLAMKLSRRLLIKIMLIVELIAAMIYGLGGGILPYWCLILASIMNGFVSATMSTMPAAIIAEFCDDGATRGKLTGYVTASQQGGALFFSLVCGALGAINWHYAYFPHFISIIVLIIQFVVMPKEESAEEAESASDQEKLTTADTLKLVPKRFYFMAIHYMLFFVCTFTFSSVMSKYVISEYALGTSAEVGIINALVTGTALVSGVIFGHAYKLLRKWTVPVYTLCLGVSYVCMHSITTSIIGCVLGAILGALGKSAIMPYVVSNMTGKVPGKAMPVIISLMVCMMNVGMFVSVYLIQPLSNLIFGSDGIPQRIDATIIISAALVIAGVLIYVVFDRSEFNEVPAKGRRH